MLDTVEELSGDRSSVGDVTEEFGGVIGPGGVFTTDLGLEEE